jgi:UDP-N-acetylmuramoyl-tripeptide--D-alanyl-D-alanine ligase
MAELGTQTESAHSEIGSYAKEQGVDELWTIGEFSALASQSFGGAARHFADKSALQEFAVRTLDDRCVALIKGSRSAGMDSITEKLSGEEKI